MYQQKKPSFLFSLYTLDLRWKMKYIGVGWVISFVYWFDHFGDLLHIFCAPVCTPLTRHFTDFIFTEAAEAFYASVLMATYSATLCSCPLVFYFFLVFFRPSLFTAESRVYQQRILWSLFFLYFSNKPNWLKLDFSQPDAVGLMPLDGFSDALDANQEASSDSIV